MRNRRPDTRGLHLRVVLSITAVTSLIVAAASGAIWLAERA